MIGKLTDMEIETVLQNNNLGRLGCNDGNRTYIVPVHYVYDGTFIVAHSVDGLKIKMMRNNPNICFEIDNIQSPNQWQSVIVWGVYQELIAERDRLQAIKLFAEKMMTIKISETALLPDISANRAPVKNTQQLKPILYRIVINEKTGRFER